MLAVAVFIMQCFCSFIRCQYDIEINEPIHQAVGAIGSLVTVTSLIYLAKILLIESIT